MNDYERTVKLFTDEITKLDEKIDSGKTGQHAEDVAALSDNKAYRRRLKNSLRQIVGLEMARREHVLTQKTLTS